MKKQTVRAFVWRDGRIEFGVRTPRGAIKVATFGSVRAALVAARVFTVGARHAYAGNVILVPGIPEACCDTDAIDALSLWTHRMAIGLRRCLPPRSFELQVAA